MKNLPWIIIGVVVVVGGIVWAMVQTPNPPAANTAVTNTTTSVGDRTEPDGTVVKSDGTMVKPDGTMIKPDGTSVAPDGTMLKPDGTVVKPDGTMIKPDGTMVGPDGQPITENTNANSNTNTSTPANTNTTSSSAAPATYATYSSATLATAQQQPAGKTVLYFHANWCPICQVLDPNIKRNISSLPSGLTILKADYDQETELKKKYGVTYQHTFVQVDSQGKKLKLWNGGTDAQDIADQLI